MPHSSTIPLLRYWHGLQYEPNVAPFRSQFDPYVLKAHLSRMMVIANDDLDYRFRLSGGFNNSFFAKNLKDELFLSLFLPSYHQALVMALDKALNNEKLVILSARVFLLEGQTVPPQKSIELEICLCPLRNTQGSCDRLIGLLQTHIIDYSEIRGAIGLLSLSSARLYDQSMKWQAAHLSLVVNHDIGVGQS